MCYQSCVTYRLLDIMCCVSCAICCILQLWNDHLRISERRVKSASEGGVDEKVERMKSSEIKLFLVSDEGGTLKIEEVKTGPLRKSDLNSKVVLLIGLDGVYLAVRLL